MSATAELFLALNGAVPGVKATPRRKAVSRTPLTTEEVKTWTAKQLHAILLVQGLTLKEVAEDDTLLALVATLETAIEAANGAMNRHYEESGKSLRAHLASQAAIRAEMCILDATKNPIELACDPGTSKESAAYVRLHTLGISKKLIQHYEDDVHRERTYTSILGRHPLMNVEHAEEVREVADVLHELRRKVAPLQDVIRRTLQLRDFLEYRRATWRRRHHLLGVFH